MLTNPDRVRRFLADFSFAARSKTPNLTAIHGFMGGSCKVHVAAHPGADGCTQPRPTPAPPANTATTTARTAGVCDINTARRACHPGIACALRDTPRMGWLAVCDDLMWRGRSVGVCAWREGGREGGVGGRGVGVDAYSLWFARTPATPVPANTDAHLVSMYLNGADHRPLPLPRHHPGPSGSAGPGARPAKRAVLFLAWVFFLIS